MVEGGREAHQAVVVEYGIGAGVEGSLFVSPGSADRAATQRCVEADLLHALMVLLYAA